MFVGQAIYKCCQQYETGISVKTFDICVEIFLCYDLILMQYVI